MWLGRRVVVAGLSSQVVELEEYKNKGTLNKKKVSLYY